MYRLGTEITLTDNLKFFFGNSNLTELSIGFSMNKILMICLCVVIILIVLFYAIGFNVENISTTEIKQKLNNSNSSIGIIDVRTKSEYESGHIENSLWIPLNQLESNIDKINSQNYQKKIKQISCVGS